MAVPFAVVEQDLVGEDIELLLLLALRIQALGAAKRPGQRTSRDGLRDDLAGRHQVVEERAELAGGTGRAALLFDDEFAERGSSVMHFRPCAPLRRAIRKLTPTAS